MSEGAEAWRNGPLRGLKRGPEVMFGQVREDVSLERSLARGRALCIASGGDTAFSLLLGGAERVRAVDINPAQLLLVKLKMAAVERLPYGDLVHAMAVDARPGYAVLRSGLSAEVAEHFDLRQEDLSRGLQNCGKVDGAIRRLVWGFEHSVSSRKVVDSMLRCSDLEAQRVFHSRYWDSWRWRVGIRLAFNQLSLRMVFGRHFAVSVPEGFADRFREDMDAVLTEVPVARNPYVWQTFRGSFPPGAMQDWLTDEGVRALVGRLGDLELVEGDVIAGLGGDEFDLVCLSNVLDGAENSYKKELSEALVRRCKAKGLVISRSLFHASTGLVEAAEGALKMLPLPEWTDRSFFCRHVELMEVAR